MKKLLAILLVSTAFNLLAQPANNDRADAILLNDLSDWTSSDAAYTTVGATMDGTLGTCGSFSNNVWFKFQATTNEIDIKVLKGGTKGTIGGSYLTLQDESGNTILCQVNYNMTYIQTLSLTPGAWYYISVDSPNDQAGTFTLSVNDIVNYDLKAKAQLLNDIGSWVSGDAAFSTVDATMDGTPGTCGSFSNNVWFKFQATTNEIDIKVLKGGTKGTIGGLYLTLQDESGNTVACQVNYSRAYIQTLSLTPGTWYYISVDSQNDQAGTFTLSVSDIVNYDLRAKAEVLNDVSAWVSGDAAFSTVDATMDGTPGTCGSFSNNVWFKFQATTNEIDIKVLKGGTKGSIGGSYLTLQDESGNTIVCQLNYSRAYIQTLSLTPGAWYYISVDSPNEQAGTFTLSVSDIVNYDFRAKAEILNDINSWVSADAMYTTVGATMDGTPGTCGSYSNNVWFKFQATTNQVDVRVLSGGAQGTIGAKYLTLQNESGNTIACQISHGSLALIQALSLTPGQWYYISVDSHFEYPGTFTLSINDDVGNDFKVAAEEISHMAQWCSTSAGYDNLNATTDIIDNASCAVPFLNNVWFKFKASSANVVVRFQTGSDKGTLTNGTLHLTDENTILKCISATNFEEAVLDYSSLQKGFWYYISVGGTAGSFTLCVDGGTAPSQLCESIYCDSEGNVGIGTPFSANGYKLSVHGKIMAEGVKVELQSKWPDYVFETDYRLLTLSELREYIDKNGHLPDVPKAAEIENEGIDLAEMNAVLLKKIEEVTLYLIKQNAEITRQNSVIKELQEEIKMLKQ